MENVLFATAALWILELVLVSPLAAFFSRRRALQTVMINGAGAVQGTAGAGTDDGSYILASTLVLGTVGFMLGMAGFWFVGFTMKAKAWPGMLAFIGLSLLGYQMSKGF